MNKVSVIQSITQIGVKGYAPASAGNVTCGFDLLGMAFDKPGDEVFVSFNDSETTKMIGIEGDDGRLPLGDDNTAVIAVKALQKHIDTKKGLDIYLKKNLPLCSGMGSSAASAVATLVAANKIYGNPLSKEELIPFSLEAEAAISGSVHGDNALPSLLGGLVLITGYEPLSFVRLPIPDNLYCVLIHPDLEVSTKMAREILPKQISLKDSIKQNACLSGFVAACYTNNLDLLKNSLYDYIAEPHRASLIQDFSLIKQKAMDVGAMHLGISGSGPSMFAFGDTMELCEQIGHNTKSHFASLNIGCQYYVSEVSEKGAYVAK